MCGINGISTSKASRGAFVRMVSDMTIMNRKGRGNDSHGFATLMSTGQFKTFRKLGIPNDEYILHKFAEDTTSAALGHVRAASQGAVTLENAHPYYNDKVAMIHNGHVYGRDLHRHSYGKTLGVTLRGDNDSEMIFHIFNSVWDKSTNINSLVEALQKTLDQISGMANLLFMFKDGTMMAYKDNTLSVNIQDDAVLFASTPPHDDEVWQSMARNSVIIVKDGKPLLEEVLKVSTYTPKSYSYVAKESTVQQKLDAKQNNTQQKAKVGNYMKYLRGEL